MDKLLKSLRSRAAPHSGKQSTPKTTQSLRNATPQKPATWRSRFDTTAWGSVKRFIHYKIDIMRAGFNRAVTEYVHVQKNSQRHVSSVIENLGKGKSSTAEIRAFKANVINSQHFNSGMGADMDAAIRQALSDINFETKGKPEHFEESIRLLEALSEANIVKAQATAEDEFNRNELSRFASNIRNQVSEQFKKDFPDFKARLITFDDVQLERLENALKENEDLQDQVKEVKAWRKCVPDYKTLVENGKIDETFDIKLFNLIKKFDAELHPGRLVDEKALRQDYKYLLDKATRTVAFAAVKTANEAYKLEAQPIPAKQVEFAPALLDFVKGLALDDNLTKKLEMLEKKLKTVENAIALKTISVSETSLARGFGYMEDMLEEYDEWALARIFISIDKLMESRNDMPILLRKILEAAEPIYSSKSTINLDGI